MLDKRQKIEYAHNIAFKGGSFMNNAERAAKAVELLKKEYPDAVCSLEYKKPHELLIATRHRRTDAQVHGSLPAD